jgi:hypothetical protein
MEDVVAVEATLTSGAMRYFLTWGRVFDAVDPAELIACIEPHLPTFALDGELESVRVCETLQEAAHAPYFFEALIRFSQRAVPYGEEYESWRSRMRGELQSGKQLYYLGGA